MRTGENLRTKALRSSILNTCWTARLSAASCSVSNFRRRSAASWQRPISTHARSDGPASTQDHRNGEVTKCWIYPPDTTGIALRRQLKIEEKTAHVGRLKKDHEVGDTVLRKQGEIVATHSKEPEAQNSIEKMGLTRPSSSSTPDNPQKDSHKTGTDFFYK